MAHIGCCVPGCEDPSPLKHRFPNPKTFMEVFNIWVFSIQIVDLFGMYPFKVHDNKRVYRRLYICQVKKQYYPC